MEQSNEEYIFNVTITSERYYKDENSWGVYCFSTVDDIPHLTTAINPFGDEEKISTLCGKVQKLYIGSNYKVKARLEYNNKYSSYQYNPISVVAFVPKTLDEKMVFMSAITTHNTSNNLLNEFPNIIEDVINGSINRESKDVLKVKGIGSTTWEKIYDKIIDNYIVSDIIIMLQPLGVSFNLIKKLIMSEPNPSLLKEKLEENPYIITSIGGIGFKKADELALKLKPELINSISRLTAFVVYYLKTTGETLGHTYISIGNLKSEIANNVPECYDKLDELLEHNSFIHCDNLNGEIIIGMKAYYDTEINISKILMEKSKNIIDKFKFDEEKVKESIEKSEQDQGFKYTKEQLECINEALKNDVFLLSGKAGSAKTTVSRGILRAYIDNGYTIKCMAMSAKAGQRISEATGLAASTIHRGLGAIGLNSFKYNHTQPLKEDVIFVDEASMINCSLFYNLLCAVGENSRIIIVGDHKQLSAIGYGSAFSDIISKKDYFNTFVLKKVMRQAEMSGILSDANKVRDGINPVKKPDIKVINGELKDMYYMFRDNREQLQSIAINTYLKTIDVEGMDNVVIAIPRRKNCINSSDEINKKIQELLFKNEVDFIDKTFCKYYKGDKVMQTTNNYDKEIFNGEIGYIKNIYKEKVDGEDKYIKVCDIEFNDLVIGDKKIIKYTEEELNQLDLAYACTVHKLQGSSYSTVIGIVDNTHYALLDKSMLYTLMTRAKTRCLLLAEPSSFIKCIRTDKNKRNTWLSLI